MVCMRLWLFARFCSYLRCLVLICATWLVFARLGANLFSIDFGYLCDLVFVSRVVCYTHLVCINSIWAICAALFLFAGLVLICAIWRVFAQLGANLFSIDFGYLRDLVFIRGAFFLHARLGGTWFALIRRLLFARLCFCLWGLVLICATWFARARLGATWLRLLAGITQVDATWSVLDFGYLLDLVFIWGALFWLVDGRLGATWFALVFGFFATWLLFLGLGSYLRELVCTCLTWRDLVRVRFVVLICATWLARAFFVFARYLVFTRPTWRDARWSWFAVVRLGFYLWALALIGVTWFLQICLRWQHLA